MIPLNAASSISLEVGSLKPKIRRITAEEIARSNALLVEESDRKKRAQLLSSQQRMADMERRELYENALQIWIDLTEGGVYRLGPVQPEERFMVPAVTLSPATVFMLGAVLHHKSPSKQLSTSLYRSLSVHYPKNFATFCNLGAALQSHADYDGAIIPFMEARVLQPRNALPVVHLLELYTRESRFSDAMETYDEFMKRAMDDLDSKEARSWKYYNHPALDMERRNMEMSFEETLPHVKKLMMRARSAYAMLSFMQKAYKDAEAVWHSLATSEWYEEVVQLSNTSWLMHFNHGVALYAQGKVKAAKRAWGSAWNRTDIPSAARNLQAFKVSWRYFDKKFIDTGVVAPVWLPVDALMVDNEIDQPLTLGWGERDPQPGNAAKTLRFSW